MTWTNEETEAINELFQKTIKFLIDEDYTAPIASSAIMALSAHLAVMSEETDERLIELFKNCLFDARIQEKTIN